MHTSNRFKGRGCVRIGSLRTRAKLRAAMRHNTRKDEVPHARKMLEPVICLHGAGLSADEACRKVVAERSGKPPSKRELWAYEVECNAPKECVDSTDKAKRFGKGCLAWTKKHCRGELLWAGVHLDEQVAHFHGLFTAVDGPSKKPFFAKWARRWLLKNMQSTFANEVGSEIGFSRGVENTGKSYVRTKEFRAHIDAAEAKRIVIRPEHIPKPNLIEIGTAYQERAAAEINATLEALGMKEVCDQAEMHVLSRRRELELTDSLVKRDGYIKILERNSTHTHQRLTAEKDDEIAVRNSVQAQYAVVVAEVTSTLTTEGLEQVLGGDAEIHPVVGTFEKPSVAAAHPRSQLERIMVAVPCNVGQAYRLLLTQLGEKLALAELHAALALNPGLLADSEISAPVRVPLMDYVANNYVQEVGLGDIKAAGRMVDQGRIWADARGRVIIPHLTTSHEIKGWTAVDSDTKNVNVCVRSDETAGIWFGDAKSGQAVLTGDIGLAIQAHARAPDAWVICLPPTENRRQKIFSDHCLNGRRHVAILKEEDTPAETITYLEGLCRHNQCNSSVIVLDQLLPALGPAVKRPLGLAYDTPFTSIPDDELSGPGVL